MIAAEGGAPSAEEASGDPDTEDTLRNGQVHLFQPAHGFRSSLDPVLLADFIDGPLGAFVDIGCGTGALTFLLAHQDAAATGVAVEIQPRLAALATRGLAANGLVGRITILGGDVRRATGQAPLLRRAFDLVATNPPFRPLEGGVTSPLPERASAHHEVSLALAEWLDCAAALLRPGGRLAVVFPAERLTALLSGCETRALTATRLRMVHPRRDAPASRVLLEARLQGRQPLRVVPPLVLHEADGGFSPAVRQMLGRP